MTFFNRYADLILYGSLLAVLLLAVALAAALARRNSPAIARLRRLLPGPARWWAGAAETAILLTLLFACSFGPLLSGYASSETGFSHPVPVESIIRTGPQPAPLPSLLGIFAFFCVRLTVWGGGLVVLSRIARTRSLFLAGALAWVLLGLGGLWWHEVWPIEREIRPERIPGLFEPGLLLGTVSTVVSRLLFWILLTLLAGLYAVRRSFSYGRFLAGCLIGDLLTYWFLFPFWAGLAPLAISFLFPVFCLALILLPGQRRALERLTGLALHPRSEGAQLPSGAGAALFGNAAILLTAAFVLSSAFVNSFERQQWEMFVRGSKPAWHPPTLRNAYGDLKRHFLKENSPQLDWGLDKELDPLLAFLDVTPPEQAEEVWQKVSPERFRRHLEKFAPVLADLEAAARADYLELPGTNWLSFLPLREASRLLAYRSMLAVSEKRPEDALRDIRTLLRVGALMRHAPGLIYQMIGVAIQGTGFEPACSFYLAARGSDPAALEALAGLLREEKRNFRAGLDAEALRRGEVPLFQKIVPNAPVLLADPTSALFKMQRLWARFDLLRLAVALDLYARRHGSPPPSLDRLAPDFLEEIPIDPFAGRPYGYELMTDGQFRLWLDREVLGTRSREWDAELRFPFVAAAEDRETSR